MKRRKKLDLNFKVIPTKYFLKQFSQLNKQEKDLINKKIEFLKENPFRFKKLVGFKNTFEIKITIKKSFSRLIYIIYKPEKNNITIFGIFNRGKDFKDYYNYYKYSYKK